MPATLTLPSDYHLHKKLDLSTSRASLWLNLAGVPLFFLFGWVFVRLIALLRVDDPFSSGVWGALTSFKSWGLLVLLLAVIFMFVFHELIHGLFFWLFTHQRPKFAFKGAYAFASAPDWYLPGSQYIIVGLSPLVIISILSVILGVFLPPATIPYILVIATLNAAGALGDIIVVAWVLAQSNSVLIRDQGDIFTSFGPINE